MANYRSLMDGNEPIFPIESMYMFVILSFCFYLNFKLIVELIGLVNYSKSLCPSNPLVVYLLLCGGSIILVILGVLDFGNSYMKSCHR